MKQFGLWVFVAGGVWAQSPAINELPSREFGQLRLLPFGQATSSAPNLVEGRELSSPRGIAFDTSVSPPILYVADYSNHRVLAWLNPAGRIAGDKADLVIGQRDLLSTLPLGPGTTLSTGLRYPTSVAVDRGGNLYVLDAGNNRILRYPTPFRQSGDLLPVDLVIGQRSVGSGNQANQGQSQPSEKTLAFQVGGEIVDEAGIAFDSQGNLWVTDFYNNRVLRFPAAVLTGTTLEPPADLVLGQPTFASNSIPQDSGGENYYITKTVTDHPLALAFDQSGRLFVVDNRGRVLVYTSFAMGAAAARILGIPARPSQGQQVTFPNSYSVGQFSPQGGLLRSAEGVFTSGNNVFVLDSGDNRIMRFGPFETWPGETSTAYSPAAVAVIGQDSFAVAKPQRGQTEANASGFARPVAGAFLGTDMWVSDAGNNRVLSFSQSGSLVFASASKVLGQYAFNYNSPNLVEGRELWVAASNFVGGAVVVDKNSNPPRLYIADTLNNRVLGFRDARRVGTDTRGILEQRADLVIGQPDVFHTTVNYPSADPLILSDTGLSAPTGLAVDANGNLWVADTGNGRVLRFPSPFTLSPGVLHHANIVLGQANFNSPPVKDAGTRNMNQPSGLAMLTNGSLAVSDIVHNRVLIFRPVGDFASYQAASVVLGEPDFSSSGAGSAINQLRSPRHIAGDSSDRLYIADTGNNRIVVYTNLSSGPSSAFQLGGMNAPFGISVSQVTGEIWVANTNSNVIYRYPEFQQLQLNPAVTPAQIQTGLPIAVTLDSFDNLIVVEGLNRATFYFAKAITRHAASYNGNPLAPGQLALLGRLGKDFALTQTDGTGIVPWSTTLADIQVLVNGVLAPIFQVLPNRIDFQVPMSTPVPGPVEFLVQRASTGEVLAAVTQTMASKNPGFFTLNQSGTGQAAAVNQDGTINGPANPVGRGQVIAFYLTGQGVVDGAPQDGLGTSGPLSTRVKPHILSATCGGVFPDSAVEYSGLAPGYPGLWQVNVKVPDACAPGNATQVVLTLEDVPSNVFPNPGSNVTFAVR
jgi:uncharacterized protein (TIGR03437 family)